MSFENRSRNVESVRHRAEAERGDIFLVMARQQLAKSCCTAEHNRQNACCHRVKSARMAAFLFAADTAYSRHRSERCQVFRLVENDNSGHSFSTLVYCVSVNFSLNFFKQRIDCLLF